MTSHRSPGRLSRFIAGCLVICIGLASVQVAWAESPERDHDPVVAVSALTGEASPVGGQIAQHETVPDDGCGGLCLCACHCPHAQPGAAAPGTAPTTAEPAHAEVFPRRLHALASVTPTPRLRPPVL